MTQTGSKRKRPQLKPGFIPPLAPTRIGGCSLVVLTPCWTSGVVRTYVHRVWGLGTKRRRDSGPRIQAPGFRPPDSGPRPQDSGPRIQAPGPRLQPPRGAVLAWFECSFVRTHVCTCVYALRVLGPGSDMHCSSAASGGGSPKGLFSCVWGGGVGVPLGVAECGSPRVGQISKESCRFGVPVLSLRLRRAISGSWVLGRICTV